MASILEPVRFEPWQNGGLDIHHISTGRGNATLLICPDGTSILVDAGAIYDRDQYCIAAKPDGSCRPGEWIARYASRHLRAAHSAEIDYAVITHFHPDHVGAISAETPLAPHGLYHLSGLMDVVQSLPVRCFIDRCFPAYDYPAPLTDRAQVNYRAFIAAQQQAGNDIQRFRVGSAEQIRLRRTSSDFPSFVVRNIAANGEVWTGHGDTTTQLFAQTVASDRSSQPTENECSLAFRLSYGKFRYYTGGDLSNNTNYGADPWRDIETPVAQITGPVDVAVANHHAYVDAVGPEFVRALRPSVFIIPTWDSAHPAISPLDNMLSRRLYPDDRAIFATAMKPENEVANKRIREMAGTNGHVVVRVAPDGNSYKVFVIDNCDETDRVLSVHGPFICSDKNFHEIDSVSK